MNNAKTIEQLIQQHCPNGVEMAALNSLLDYEQPGAYIVKSTDYNDSYSTPVLTAGQSFILGYTDEQSGIYNASKENPTIIFDDFTTSFHWVDFDFKVKSSAMKMLRPNNSGNSFRYIFYAMSSIGFVPSEHSRHWISKYSQFEIPLPPLPVQEEIVRILDAMSGLVENLDEEIKARKKQYEHYREQLLTFNNEVKKQKLGEICTIKARIGWQRLNKSEYLTSGDYYLVTGVDIKGHRVNFKSCYYVNEERYRMDENIQLRNGDVILTKDGTIGKVALIEEMDKPAVLNSHLFVIRAKYSILNEKFFMYVLTSKYFEDFIDNNKTQGTIPGLNQATMVNFLIPLPPLSVQQEIVEKLDAFEALIQNLQAERDLRQKQYEYYREKLLTFE